MGKFDRRNSQKMKRRKAQVKKKARLKRKRTASAKPQTAPKKTQKKSGPPWMSRQLIILRNILQKLIQYMKQIQMLNMMRPMR